MIPEVGLKVHFIESLLVLKNTISWGIYIIHSWDLAYIIESIDALFITVPLLEMSSPFLFI